MFLERGWNCVEFRKLDDSNYVHRGHCTYQVGNRMQKLSADDSFITETLRSYSSQC